MTKPRASIFSGDDAIDVSDFAPKPAATPGPPQEAVKAVSEAAHFRSREAAEPKPAQKAKRKPRLHRTGRNVQFNVKASQQALDDFYAISEQQSWVLGYTLERAVAALKRELEES